MSEVYLGYLIQSDNDDGLIDELMDMIGLDLTEEEENAIYAGQLEFISLKMRDLIENVYNKTNDILKVVAEMNRMIKKYYTLMNNPIHYYNNMIVIGLPFQHGEDINDLKVKNNLIKTILDDIFTIGVNPVVIDIENL